MKGKNEWQERPAKRRKSIKEETESKLEQSFLQSSFEDAYPAIIEKLSLNMDGWLGSKELMEQLKVQPLATVMSLEPEKLLKIYKFTTKKLKSNNKMEPIYCLDANPLSSLVSSRLGLWSRLWEEYGKVKFLIYFQCFLTLKNGKLEFNIGIFILDSIKAPEEAIMASGTSSIYTSLIDQIFPSPFIESRKDTQINTNLFYDNARQLAKSLPTVDVRRDKRLLSDLLPFQRRSLEWMIHREKDSSKDSCSLPPLWNEYQLPHNDRKVFVNRTYGYITLSKENVFQLAPAALKGGVLADEMGMGKTLEVLSLVLFHQPPIDKLLSTQFDSVLQKNVIFSKATLIITPSTILDQWISEVELHVPSLKISHYKGIRKSSGSFSLDQFLDADIVITSYSDLRFELLYAESFSRNLRHEKRHVPPKSPLIDICWWRICVDEAQMVETSQSNVAQMIYRIPRVNCWAVSGTPVRGNVDDLFGLLFLFRYSPIYQHRKQTWIQIMELNRVHEFCDIFSPLVCRNCKQDIAHELRLPPQHRRYMPTRLTVVEETNYQDLLTEAAKSLKYLDDQLLDLSQLDTMKRWLIRLRQACCHPQVGSGNKSAFGGGPMKSINDVLMFMLEQTNSSLSSTKRQFFSDVVTTGWVFDHLQDYGKALAIWNEILPTVETVVVDLEGAISRTEIDPDESKSHLNLSYAGLNYPGNIRAWQVLLHKVYFFIASTNFALKNEELEKKYYSLAQDLRRKMMSDIIKKTSKHIDEFGKQFSRKNFVVLPKLPKASSKGTILSYLVVEDYEQLREQLNLQAESLVKFRDRLIYLMKLPLLDQESDPTGDEYEESLNAQSEISYCIDVYRQMISDRVAAIDGTINTFVSHETELEKYKLLENIENAQEIGEKETEERNKKYMLFFEEREEARPKTNEYGTFENILARLADALGRSNTSSEYTIAQRLFEQLNEVTKDQSKTCRKLEKELSLIQLTYNMRIDYYKHLQEISDSLIPPTAPKVSQSQASYIKMEQKDLFESALRHAEEKYNKKLEEEEQSSKSKPASESLDEMISRIDIPAHLLLLKELSTEKQNNLRKIGHFESRLRYLSNLYEHAVFKAGSKQQCIICRDIIKKGFITTCGHFYCKDCLVAWLKHHPSCPMCKSKLTKNSAYYIGEGFDIRLRQEFVLGFPNKEKDLEVMDEETLKQIVSIPLKVSFGSKIDAIVRHLTYLKRIELYPKVVVFSQWLDVLEVLHKSFEANGVSYLRFDGKTKISCLKNFKADRDIEVLTLHSRSQSAGLTLTNATHVIMCKFRESRKNYQKLLKKTVWEYITNGVGEPLLNSGIELQAISRVHRIGQTRPTYVYYYIVEDTVEDHIMSMSIQKHKQLGRLGLDVPLIGSIQRSTDSSFGGEVVDESEIRECLKTALKRLDLEGEEGL